MKKVLVAGCGLVGKTIALDLSQDFDVTVMDPSESSLASIDNPNIKKSESLSQTLTVFLRSQKIWMLSAALCLNRS